MGGILCPGFIRVQAIDGNTPWRRPQGPSWKSPEISPFTQIPASTRAFFQQRCCLLREDVGQDCKAMAAVRSRASSMYDAGPGFFGVLSIPSFLPWQCCVGKVDLAAQAGLA